MTGRADDRCRVDRRVTQRLVRIWVAGIIVYENAYAGKLSEVKQNSGMGRAGCI